VFLALVALLFLAAGPGAGGLCAEDGRPGGGRAGGGRGRGGPPGGGREDGRGGPPGVFTTDVPAHDLDVVLGRPTRDAVVLSVRSTAAAEGCVAWGPRQRGAARRTAVEALPAGTCVTFRLEGLEPDTAYTAIVLHRATPGDVLAPGESVSFHTQRAPGQPFTFTVQADSHLDQGTDPALYVRTLGNVAADVPDFHVDLGDTFMTDKYRDDFHAALPQYDAQRWYFGLARVPVFLVLGNHDGEAGWRDRGQADDMPHWANAQRKLRFPNPEPDGFYTGNDVADPLNGRLQDWYAWTWGDALFVVLDPYWSTRDRRGRDADGWTWTLGESQYRWLARTLETTRARWRFVFIHHLVGGQGPDARGGAEAARLYEWGGSSPDGTNAFAAQRPGWPAPIHDLLARAGPTVVFHGHDHFYARQERDGVVYQLVPQPGHAEGDAAKMAAEYGYAAGDFLSSPGHVRVRVGVDAATVEYVCSAAGEAQANGAVVRAYEVRGAARPRGANGR
jgi:hypothetical protein